MNTLKPAQDQKNRRWILTLWAKDISQEQIETALQTYNAYAGQLEQCPTTGKLHYHVLVEHANAIRFSTLAKKFPGGHYEIARGTDAALAYVTKTETAYPAENPARFRKGKFTFEQKTAAERSRKFADLYAAVKAGNNVDTLVLQYPEAAWHVNKLRTIEQAVLTDKWAKTTREVTVTYIHGVTGSGKTHSVYAKHGFADTYIVDDYKHPFDNYNGQPVVVFDEFHSDIEFGYLLKLLDKWPVTLNARYNNKWAAYTHVYIISNEPLDAQYPDIRSTKPKTWAALKRRITHIQHFATTYQPTTQPAATP